MNLREYIYVDVARVRSYFEQLDGAAQRSGVTWKVGLSLSGPSIEAGNKAESSERTVHAMITALEGYLREKGGIKEGRAFFYGHSHKPFAEDAFHARRITWKSERLQKEFGLQHLSIWISDLVARTVSNDAIDDLRRRHGDRASKSARRFSGRFYLIESVPLDAVPLVPVNGMSGWGVLRAMLSIEITRAPLADLLDVPSIGYVTGSDPQTGKRAARLIDDQRILQECDEDPVGFFHRRGAIVSDVRFVRALYRRRFQTYGQDMRSIEIGYPLYILDASSEEPLTHGPPAES